MLKWWRQRINHPPRRHLFNINNGSNNHTTPVEQISTDKMDKGAAVAMAAAMVAVVQALAEAVAVGLDTSNQERAGQATSNKQSQMRTAMRTSDRLHQT